MTTKQDLLQLIEADAQKHVRFLQALIQAPSPNPPGDTRRAVEVVRAFLRAEEVPTEIVAVKEEAPNLVGVFHAGDGGSAGQARPSIILNGHVDQFPVEDREQWQRDPYSGDVEDGFVHGRSGVDMKAGTAASVIAYTYLYQRRSQLTGRCVLQVVSDEETGGKLGTRYLLEDHATPELWKADCMLGGEPGGLESIRFGEKGTLRLTFTVTALGAHGAYIHRSEGAIRIATRLIEKLVQMERDPGSGMDPALREYMQRPDVRAVADDIMWPGAAAAMLVPTVNIGTIRGGVKINMIPSTCVFEADIRIPIGVATESIRARVDGILEAFPTATYAVHGNHSHVSTHSPRDHELVRLLQENAEAVGGRRPVPICSLGATDCKHFRRHGVPAYEYGPSPRGMAERDEKVGVEEFLHLVKVHTLTAWDYLGGSAV